MECSELGGGVQIFFSLRNVPGVLKRKKEKKNLSSFSLLNFFFQKCSWGGGRKTIHFFL